jgi:hypothetical protein
VITLAVCTYSILFAFLPLCWPPRPWAIDRVQLVDWLQCLCGAFVGHLAAADVSCRRMASEQAHLLLISLSLNIFRFGSQRGVIASEASSPTGSVPSKCTLPIEASAPHGIHLIPFLGLAHPSNRIFGGRRGFQGILVSRDGSRGIAAITQ